MSQDLRDSPPGMTRPQHSSHWATASASAVLFVAALVLRERNSIQFGDKRAGFREELDVAQSAKPWEVPETALRDYAFLRDRVIEEHGWTVARAEGAIVEYLRFLQLLAEAPRMELVASSDIDLVWHEHLMDTQNYAIDSQKLFGRFLHHRRARTADEFAEIPASYEMTKVVYSQRFGQAPPADFWGASTQASSMCGGGGGVDPSQSGPANSGDQSSSDSSDAATNAPASTSSTSNSSSSNRSNSTLIAALAAASTAAALFVNDSASSNDTAFAMNGAASVTPSPHAAFAWLLMAASCLPGRSRQ